MIFLRSKRLEKKTSDAREPSLYRSICTSIISTLLSLVMLVGTTFAWFTDSVTSNVFTITAGNFPAKTYYWVGNNDPESITTENICKCNDDTKTMGWRNAKECTNIFEKMRLDSEDSSQLSKPIYFALVNGKVDGVADGVDTENAATYKFYFESVAESNSEGSNNIKNALTFTYKMASTIGGLTNVTAETRTLAEFAGPSEANSGPFVITVEENTTKYVELTIDVGDISHASITPSSIQLQLQIDITSGGDPANAALTTVRKTMRRPADRDEYSIADDSGVVTIIQTKPPVTEEAESNDTDTSGAAEDGGNADTSGGAVDTAADTAAVEPNAADDVPAADSAA